jgi:hypothetical protein
MGCFNVSCGLSGISMYSDDALLIPLVPQDFYARKNSGKFTFAGANIVTNDGAKSLFSPLTLPIFGKLDSYGKLEDIQEDANTKAIEKYFGMKIAEFSEGIAYGWEKTIQDKHPKLKHVAGMYMHRGIWDKMSKGVADEFGKSSSALENASMIDDVLLAMGFEDKNFSRKDQVKLKVEKGEMSWDAENKLSYNEQEKRRYHRLFTHPLFAETQVWSDEQWIRVEKVGSKKAGDSAYHPDALIEILEKNSKTKTKFPEAVKKELETKHYNEYVFLAALRQLDESKEAEKIWSTARANLEDDKERKYTPRYLALSGAGRELSSLFNLGSFNDSDDVIHFLDLYGDVIDKVKDLVIAQKNIDMAMFACNRLYMPTFNGYQHGNIFAEKMLHEAALQIINADIAERKKNNGDDD